MTSVGVLLINTGTPDNPDEESIRRFLEEMLSDPALISVPLFIWKRVLKHFILPNRPKKTVGLYRKMWGESGSIFMNASKVQRTALEAELRRRSFSGGDVQVALAMRYGNPSISSQLARLCQSGCEELVVVPLYPQYANVCAGTCFSEFDRCLRALRDEGCSPVVHKVGQFYDQPAYREALAALVKRHWTYQPGSKLVVSFHSTVMKDIDAGDPYREQTRETARRLASDLGVADEDWVVSYQSRFDSRKWLQPFTADVLEHMGTLGVADVCVVCPGFVAENIESKVEAGEQLRDEFLKRAVSDAHYTYVPTLDDDLGLITALADAIEQTTNRA